MDSAPAGHHLQSRQHIMVMTGAILLGALLLAAIAIPNLLRARIAGNASKVAAELASAASDRKVVRTCSVQLVVNNPEAVAEEVRRLAEGAGGFLVTADAGGQEASNAALTIRVPAQRFEEIRAAVRKLGLRVEGERIEAQDVTKQDVDDEARLRNLRAQETQYLAILRQARTVKDTLEVSDKLNEVRGEIEQQQGEFEVLSKQVETVALAISLRAEVEAQVWGLHWQPLYQLKLAARDGLSGLGDYAAAMTSFLFYLPAVLLWLATILIGAAVGWRLLRWTARLLFVSPKTPLTQKSAS